MELLASGWESFPDLETRGQHVAALLFQRVANGSHGACLNETLPGKVRDLSALWGDQGFTLWKPDWFWVSPALRVFTFCSSA